MSSLNSTIQFLNSNNIKYLKIFNYIISLPTQSIHNNFLNLKNTKQISFTIPFKKSFNYITILITKY